MKRMMVCTAVVGMGLLAGGAGWAASDAAAGGHPMGRLANTAIGRLITGRLGRAMTLRSELNLSDEQRAAIRQTVMAHRQEIAAAARPVAQARRALRDAVLADKTDESAIRRAADQLGHSVGDAAVVLAHVKTDLAAKANLTDEQIKKIADFRAANDAAVDEMFKQIEQEK